MTDEAKAQYEKEIDRRMRAWRKCNNAAIAKAYWRIKLEHK
jgi:hypothetical protein